MRFIIYLHCCPAHAFIHTHPYTAHKATQKPALFVHLFSDWGHAVLSLCIQGVCISQHHSDPTDLRKVSCKALWWKCERSSSISSQLCLGCCGHSVRKNRCLMAWHFDTSVLKYENVKIFSCLFCRVLFICQTAAFSHRLTAGISSTVEESVRTGGNFYLSSTAGAVVTLYWFLGRKFILHKSPAVALRLGVKRTVLRLEPDTYSGSMYTLKGFFPTLTLILKSARLSQSCRRRRSTTTYSQEAGVYISFCLLVNFE